MYKIVYANDIYLDDAVKEVEQKVNELKKEGWLEQGGISISFNCEENCCFPCTVAQAMKK